MRKVVVNSRSKVILVFWCFFSTLILYSQTAVSTYNSIGIYWQPESGSADKICSIKYRVVGSTKWKSGYPLWFDKRSNEYRGSIVHLTSGTNYEIQLELKSDGTSSTFKATTWSDQIPIAETIYLPKYSDKTLVIDKSGTSSGYIQYTSPASDTCVIDVRNKNDLCIRIMPGVAYIVIKGIIVKGAKLHGIRIENNVHDVIIEDNDISNWGTMDMDQWGMDRHSGIFSGLKDENITRIVIQRNKIHHPRAGSNSWAEKRRAKPADTTSKFSNHPKGPNAIHLGQTNGNLVIRYNEIYSGEQYFNDGLGGAGNYTYRGFPNRDSDIYGNIISHCWDDGIESEGANENVRIWDNYIDKTYVKIAIAGTSIGPLYIWRNIANRSRRSAVENVSDQYGRGPFIKAGGRSFKGTFYGGGKTYVFHNTVLQPMGPGKYPLGCEASIQSSGGRLHNLTTRNNIFINYKNWRGTFINNSENCTNDFDFDIFSGKIIDNCKKNVHQKNGYKVNNTKLIKFNSTEHLRYSLVNGSAGYDAAVKIPNFNDQYHGKGPDFGALESDSQPRFGLNGGDIGNQR